jgi:putative membrane protein
VQDKNRDYLANERTYLAYLRTALAFIAFGFVVARFSLFAREISIVAHIQVASTHASTEFGTGMAAVGVLVALYGSYRYTSTSAAIGANKNVQMPAWAAVAGSLLVAVIGVIVAVALFEVR